MRERGFTLIEVVVALAILAVSLTVLLATQAASMGNAGRVRELTVATLLTRSKMIDLEQKLGDEGFTQGDQEEKGDFSEEGYAEYKWEAKVIQVEITLDTLTDLCEGFEEETDAAVTGEGEGGCTDMLGGLGAPLEGLMTELGNSVRFIELTVTWPVNERYKDSMTVKALVTREDYGMEASNPLLDAAKNAGINLEGIEGLGK